jgi:hypothetical protein
VFTVADYAWVESGICTCGHRQKIRRFVGADVSCAGLCVRCGSPLHCQPFFLHRPVEGVRLGANLSTPFRALGTEAVPWALVRHDAGATFFHHP